MQTLQYVCNFRVHDHCPHVLSSTPAHFTGGIREKAQNSNLRRCQVERSLVRSNARFAAGGSGRAAPASRPQRNRLRPWHRGHA